MLMISHRMPELYEVASIATVLRDGKLVDSVPAAADARARPRAMMVGRELGDYYGKRAHRHGRGRARGDGLATADGKLQADIAEAAPRRDPRRRRPRRLRQGRAGAGARRRDPVRGPFASPAGGVGAATRARRSPAASASCPTTASARRCCRRARSRRTSRSRGGRPVARRRARRAHRAPRARRDQTLRRRHRLGPEPDHDAVGRQPAEGRARPHLRARRRRARARRADARHRRRRQGRDLPADAGGGRGRSRHRRSSPPSCPSCCGIADRIVVFFGGEVRAEFAAAGLDEEEIAHVAVSGASLARSADRQDGDRHDRPAVRHPGAPRGRPDAGAPTEPRTQVDAEASPGRYTGVVVALLVVAST